MNQDIEILRLLAKKDKEIEKLFNSLLYQLSKVSLNITKIREGAFFSFDDYPELKAKVDNVLNSYSEEQQDIILKGINDAMKLSFKANKEVFGEFSRYSNKALTDMRETAAEAFIESRMKPEEGLSLSQKVWNYTRQGKAEFEAGMSEILEDGLSEGMSAEELGRKLRDKLKNPDMVYKRYHMKKMTAKGKKDVVEWRRKVVDSEGKVRYVKEGLEKVGRGVYRSSRKNALRLTATETNMAYRYADYVRWNSEPFVIGFRIQLSENHTLNGKPFYDMCDDLVGVYPKTFKWSGWHPRCRCIATSILVDKDEMMKISDLSEEEYRNYRSPHLVEKMPKAYNEYVSKEKERILASMNRGTTPYWVKDNYKNGDIRKKFVWEKEKRVKTKAEKEEIQKRWDERKERYAKLMKTAQNVKNVAVNEPWVDTANLEWLINKRKYHLLENEYRKVAKEVGYTKKLKKETEYVGLRNMNLWYKHFDRDEIQNLAVLISDFERGSSKRFTVAEYNYLNNLRFKIQQGFYRFNKETNVEEIKQAINNFKAAVKEHSTTKKITIQVKTTKKGIDSKQQAKQEESFVDLSIKPTKHNLDNVLNNLRRTGIDKYRVDAIENDVSEVDIIKKISGGDKTGGSCSSLAFAYIGNKYGYDIRDFRGGMSRDFFSHKGTLMDIAKKVGGIVVEHTDDTTAANTLIRKMKEGKLYYLASGRHAAIVKKVGSNYSFLELQSPGKNGWFDLLTWYKDRFMARSGKELRQSCLVDIELLAKEVSFKDILGYINTPERLQKKGKKGSIK